MKMLSYQEYCNICDVCNIIALNSDTRSSIGGYDDIFLTAFMGTNYQHKMVLDWLNSVLFELHRYSDLKYHISAEKYLELFGDEEKNLYGKSLYE